MQVPGDARIPEVPPDPSPPEGLETQPAATRPGRPAPPSRPGERILRHPDGSLTKFYAVRAGRGTEFEALIERFCDLAPESVETLEKADLAEDRNLREQDAAKRKPLPVEVSDWIVVRGVEVEIERVDRFVNLYYASTPQIEIEARIAEITTTDALDLGALFSVRRRGRDLAGDVVDAGAFGAEFPNVSAVPDGFLTFLSTVQDRVELEHTLEFLRTRQGVDIISNPRIAVRNGGRAEILTGTEIPYQESVQFAPSGTTATLRFKSVGVKLFVVPYLAGADTIFLDVDVEVSAVTGFTAGVGGVQNPIISTRTARSAVQVKDGSTFVIGGLLASNQVEDVAKIPVLGDVPLLGALFRSTFTQKAYTEVVFFLTPRVLSEEAPFGEILIPG